MNKLSELWSISEKDIREENFKAKRREIGIFWMKLAALVQCLDSSKEEDKEGEFSVAALNAL